MIKLTFEEPDGTFGVVGMNADNKETKLYACVKKLLAYEQTELSPSDVEALKLQNKNLKARLKGLEPSTFCEKLRHARMANELRQEELAKLLNVNRTTIVKWEKGTSEPKLAILKELVKYLKIDINYLLDDEV